jgi:hypothetical protein
MQDLELSWAVAAENCRIQDREVKFAMRRGKAGLEKMGTMQRIGGDA